MTHMSNWKLPPPQDKFQTVFANPRQTTVCSYKNQVLAFTPSQF